MPAVWARVTSATSSRRNGSRRHSVTGVANEQMSEQWQRSAEHWVAAERSFDQAFTAITGRIVGAAGFGTGDVVLDVGCGTGTLLAAATGAGAVAVGVDISVPMVERARTRVQAASVHVADAESADLRALAPESSGFDAAVSRFGVMFFGDPVAAFANIRAAMRDGGRLALACWRPAAENPMFGAGFDEQFERYGFPDNWGVDDAPGPLGLARRERIVEVVEGSGWRELEITPFDVTLRFGPADDDGSGNGVDERLGMMLGNAAAVFLRERVLDADGEHAWDRVVAELRADLEARVVDGAVQYPGACWLVTARA